MSRKKPIGLHASLDGQVIGERIRALRKARGLSQSALSKQAGLHRQSISRYERGRLPDADELFRVAEALGITLLEMYTDQAAKLLRGPRELGDVILRRSGQAGPPGQVAPAGDPPGLELVAQSLRVAPQFVPWVLGLLRIFRSGDAGAVGGIQASINAFLGDLDYKKVEPAKPTGRRKAPKKWV